MTNRLRELNAVGQSIWLDYIDRTMLRDGTLERRIEEDAVTGMTSNPTIFEKALAEGTTYDDQLLAAPGDLTAAGLFELIATDDVRSACDTFRQVYDRAEGHDGFVSIEVAPSLANDTRGTIEEARRLWRTIDRPNVMVKVPGTPNGIVAVRQLIAEGINVNITLLFSIDAYRAVIEAYLAGLADRARAGRPITRVASVASFFVSRVDAEVDRRLAAQRAAATPAVAKRIDALTGRIAIANAKIAYRLFGELFSGERWERLRQQGGQVQRPLWASTSTKNPAYRDVMYVEGLIGPHTVNTMPPQTLEAFRDHGEVKLTVTRDVDAAAKAIESLEALGIALNDVTAKLLIDGLASFSKSFDAVIVGLSQKTRTLGREVAVTR